MQIGEASVKAGVAARMLRYYECQDLVVPGRDANNYRRYCEEGVLRARQVRALLEAGLPTRLIKVLLSHSEPDAPVSALPGHLVEVELQDHARALERKANELLARRRALLAYLCEVPGHTS